jgi:GNAT superfamily N-acetyltransferase
MTAIRPAQEDDAAAILALIRALAAYERLADRLEIDEARLRAALFGAKPRVFCDIAEAGGAIVGFALWFYNYSTFVGRHGIWLEDLFVVPERRGGGVGKALLAALARRCTEESLGRLEWAVLDWNEPSIGFYRSLGAVALDDWRTFRLDGAALSRLAGGA